MFPAWSALTPHGATHPLPISYRRRERPGSIDQLIDLPARTTIKIGDPQVAVGIEGQTPQAGIRLPLIHAARARANIPARRTRQSGRGSIDSGTGARHFIYRRSPVRVVIVSDKEVAVLILRDAHRQQEVGINGARDAAVVNRGLRVDPRRPLHTRERAAPERVTSIYGISDRKNEGGLQKSCCSGIQG